MPVQASFDGFGLPQPTDRLFLALQPDAATASTIAALARSLGERHGIPGAPLPATQLHVTLHYLGEFAGVPESLLSGVERAAATLDVPVFEAVFDRVASFTGGAGRQPWVLRADEAAVAPLHALHGALAARLAAAGVRVQGHAGFVPHMTLLYADRALAPEPVPAVAWQATGFVLVDSLVGRREHRVLRRWPLAT